MSTDLEKKIDKLIDAINGNNFSSGRTNTTSRAAGGDISAIADSLGKGLKFTVDSIGTLAGKAVDNTATVNDATKVVSSFLGKFGSIGGIAGDALNGLTEIITDAVGNWQQFSDFGLQFGGNAMALREAVLKTGLSFNEYAGLMEKIQPSFANFGQGLTKGAEMFGEASNKILNDPTLQRSFNLLGMNTKDVNSALATVIRGANMVNTNNETQMNALLQSAVSLAREMDMMAKLTGVSRKEQEKAIETMQQDEKVRAQIILLRKQNPDAVADIGRVQNNASALDPAVQKLLNESIAGKGIMSSDKIAEFQKVYGPEAARQIAEIGRGVTSQNKAEREKAVADTQDLIFKLAKERERGAAFIASGAVGNEFSKEAMGDRYEIVAKTLKSYMDKGMTEVTAKKEAMAVAVGLGAGKLIEDLKNKDGTITKAQRNEKGEFITDDPRSKSTEIVTGVNSEIKRFGTALNEVVNQMNTTLTTQKDANGKFKASEIANDVAGYNKAGGSRVKDFANTIKLEITTLGDFPEKWTEKIAEKIRGMLPVQGREVGSKRATGSWLEKGPKNILMGEGSQPEAVVPQDDIPEFLNDMLSSGFVSSQSSKASSPNLGGILKNVASKVSSAQKAVTDNGVVESGSASGQDPVLEKLDKISTIMERVAHHAERTERHVSDTASNTKDIGGYIG